MRHNTNTHTHHGSVLVVQTAFGPGQELTGVIFNQPFLELLFDQLKVMPCSGGHVLYELEHSRVKQQSGFHYYTYTHRQDAGVSHSTPV